MRHRGAAFSRRVNQAGEKEKHERKMKESLVLIVSDPITVVSHVSFILNPPAIRIEERYTTVSVSPAR